MNQLTHSLGVYQTIRERIIALEADIDEATLADTLEGLTDIHEILAAIVRSALLDEALAEGLKSHIQRLQERLQRLTERGAERRRIARDAMIEVAIKKVGAPDFTVSLRPGPPSSSWSTSTRFLNPTGNPASLGSIGLAYSPISSKASLSLGRISPTPNPSSA